LLLVHRSGLTAAALVNVDCGGTLLVYLRHFVIEAGLQIMLGGQHPPPLLFGSVPHPTPVVPIKPAAQVARV
jgi:hypothetical protein